MKGQAIAVNGYLETNIEGIYAIGDVIGGTMLAHVASGRWTTGLSLIAFSPILR
jgi:pyruvate/2-oxoglutarate dehydrogenase complex dihydrolipoamide dehydrogenase (E3) component